MTEFTEEKLAELRAVAEAETDGPPWEWTDVGVARFDPPTVLALIAALEAKTAEVESRIEDRDWFKARAEKAEAALERVKAMHQRVEICNSDGTHFQWECERCGYDDAQAWPCATNQAIEGESDA